MPSLPPLTLHILLIAACAIVIVCVAAAAAALCAGGFKTWCTAKQKIDAGALPLLLEARDTEASADSTFAPSSGGDSTVLGDFFSAGRSSTVAVEAAESACAALCGPDGSDNKAAALVDVLKYAPSFPPRLERRLHIVHQGPLEKPCRGLRVVGKSGASCERLFVLTSDGELASCKARGAHVYPSATLDADGILSLPSKVYSYLGRNNRAIAVRDNDREFAVTTEGKTLTLRAPSAVEREAWINVINECIAALGAKETEHAKAAVLLAQIKAKRPSWATSTPFAKVGRGAIGRVYTLHADSIHSMVRESIEWNVSVKQFERLVGTSGGKSANSLASGRRAPEVVAVDVIEVDALVDQYHGLRSAFSSAGRPTDEVWVFHGTSSAALYDIAAKGFAVGGATAGVDVRNGTVHGSGVYTAIGPDTPIGYCTAAVPRCRVGGSGASRKAEAFKAVVLARATPGQRGDVDGRGGVDSWYPRGDWAVFRRGEQLLPVYIVYFR